MCTPEPLSGFEANVQWRCAGCAYYVLSSDVDPPGNVEGDEQYPEHEGHVAHIQAQSDKPCNRHKCGVSR